MHHHEDSRTINHMMPKLSNTIPKAHIDIHDRRDAPRFRSRSATIKVKTPKKTPNAAQPSNNPELMYTPLPLLLPPSRRSRRPRRSRLDAPRVGLAPVAPVTDARAYTSPARGLGAAGQFLPLTLAVRFDAFKGFSMRHAARFARRS